MKLYLEINLGVSENSFCSVSDHFHDCNIIDSWNTPIQQSNPTSSIINSIVLYVSVTRWQTIKFKTIELIIFFFLLRETPHVSPIFLFFSLFVFFFFFFIRIIRIHPKMKNSRVFDNCFLPINIASRVIILKAVSNSKKKKKTLKNNYREILFSNRFVSLSLSH